MWNDVPELESWIDDGSPDEDYFEVKVPNDDTIWDDLPDLDHLSDDEDEGPSGPEEKIMEELKTIFAN